MSSEWYPRLVVAACIVHENKVLIHRRLVNGFNGKDRYYGKWEFPGGKVHLNEALPTAVRREVTEEIGVYLDDVVGPIHAQVNTSASGIANLVLFYHCTLSSQHPVAYLEDVAFVTGDELCLYDCLPGLREAYACLPLPFSFVANSANEQSLSDILRILTYEVGDMNKLFFKATVFPPERNVYLGDLKLETSDALSMIRRFIEQSGWGYEEVKRVGETRYSERMADIRLYGLSEKVLEEGER